MRKTIFLLLVFALLSIQALAQSAKRVAITPQSYNGWKDALIISNGSVEAVIVPSIGRVMQFRFVGEDGVFWENPAVAGKPVNPAAKEWVNFGGDKPWPAPQSDWPKITPRAWPPPIGFDSSAWEAKIGNDSVDLISPVDPHYGIRAIRRIKLDPARPTMTITTVFEKVKGEPRNVAVWIITQLKDPDLILVPMPKDSIFAEGFNKQSKELPEYFKVQNGTIAIKRDPKKSTKIGTDATTLTWIGAKHALRIEASRVPNVVYPDNGSSAEVYTNFDPLKYVELEMLGPLKEMKIGDKQEQINRYTLMPRSRIRNLKDF
ncbi:MAG: hypothetical protein JST84_01945 [Acidobacteria bacterium]|nr:hypothetical protein [Acidobacteriota bacterium]